MLVENMTWPHHDLKYRPYPAVEVSNFDFVASRVKYDHGHIWHYDLAISCLCLVPRCMDNFENLECISLILEIWKYISYFPKFGKYNAGRAIFGGYISWAAYCCHGKWRRKINTNGWDGSSIDVTSLGQAPDSGVACPGIVPRSEGAALSYEHNLTKSSMWAIILTNMLILNLPTNIYKSSNNKKYQQISTNLPTI